MPDPSLLSPNTGNYAVGKGEVEFKLEGTDVWVHMGNIPEMEFTPEIETLDHFSSMEGIRTKDLEVVLERGGTLRILMEEITANNMRLTLLGTLDENAVDGPEVEIFSENSIAGEIRYTAKNDVGPRWNLHFYNVSFIPSSSFNPISDEWQQLEVEGNVLVAGALHPQAGKVGIAKLVNLPNNS